MAWPESFHIPEEVDHAEALAPKWQESAEVVDEGFQLPDSIKERLKKVDTALFEDHLQTLPEAEQQELYEIIEKTNKLKLNKYIKKNGFIINGDTQVAFEVKFWVDRSVQRSQEIQLKTETLEIKTQELASEKAETASEKAETASEKAELASEKAETASEKAETASEKAETASEKAETDDKVSKFKTAEKLFAWKEDQFANIPEFQKLLKEAKTVDVRSASDMARMTEKFIAFFSWNKKLESVAQIMYNSSKAEYDAFKEYAKDLAPSFEARFVKFEKNIDKNQPDVSNDLHRVQVKAGLGDGAVSKYGQYLESRSGDSTVTMDISDKPPTRRIGVAGSSLDLKTDVPIGEFYKVIEKEGLAYEKTAKENQPKIEYLNRMQGQEVQEFINSDEFGKESITNAKRIISLLIGLSDDMDLEDVCGRSFSSKEDLKAFSLTWAVTRKKELEEEIQKKETKYEEALEAQVTFQKELQAEMDLVSTDAIQLITSLGLDVVWEDLQILFSDTAIKQALMDAMPWFDPNNVDPANGDFGQSGLKEDNIRSFRKNMVEFANIVYSWKTMPDTGLAFSVDTYMAMELWDVQNTKSQIWALRDDSWIIKAWATNIILIRERIKSAARG